MPGMDALPFVMLCVPCDPFCHGCDMYVKLVSNMYYLS